MRATYLPILTIALLAAVPAFADITYTFNDTGHVSGCTSACSSEIGTIIVSQFAPNEIELLFPSTDSFDWANTGAGGGNQLMFDIPGITVSLDATQPSDSGWVLVSGSGAKPGDGFSSDPTNYALDCDQSGGHCAGNGNTGVGVPPGQALFLTGTGLTPSSITGFSNDGETIYFVADVAVGGGPTGDAGATLTSTSVPDGGMTLMLLGGILVGVESLRRKVRA